MSLRNTSDRPALIGRSHSRWGAAPNISPSGAAPTHTDRVQLNLQELQVQLERATHPIVVECFASWCPHCKNFAQSVFLAHKTAHKQPGHYYPIVSMDAAKYVFHRTDSVPESCSSLYEYVKSIVPGYPTVAKLSWDGKSYSSTIFESETRDLQNLLQFAKKP